MSLINLLVSRKEVVVSLIVIGLILFLAVMLALTPVLQRSWKKRMIHQRTQKAARLARNKKSNRRNQQGVNTNRRRRPAEAAVIQDIPAVDTALIVLDESVSTPLVSEPISAVVEETPVEVSSSLQDVLNSVFVDDEANLRFEVLLKGTEPVSAEELSDLASRVASELADLQTYGSPS